MSAVRLASSPANPLGCAGVSWLRQVVFGRARPAGVEERQGRTAGQGDVHGARTSLRLALLVSLASLASGCSTVGDPAGVVPTIAPTSAASSSKNSAATTTPQVATSAQPPPSPQQRQLDCRTLGDDIELGLKDMQKARSGIAKEREALPTTLARAYGRMFGGPEDGLESVEAYRAAEARVRTLNRQQVANGCPPVDIDARIKAFDLAPMVADKPNAQPALGATGSGPTETGSVTSSSPQLPQWIKDLTGESERSSAASAAAR